MDLFEKALRLKLDFSPKYIERLTKLHEMLKRLMRTPEWGQTVKLDMVHWGRITVPGHACNTVCCLAGFASCDPWFNQEGLTHRYATSAGNCVKGAIIPQYRPSEEEIDYWLAVNLMSSADLDRSYALFGVRENDQPLQDSYLSLAVCFGLNPDEVTELFEASSYTQNDDPLPILRRLAWMIGSKEREFHRLKALARKAGIQPKSETQLWSK